METNPLLLIGRGGVAALRRLLGERFGSHTYDLYRLDLMDRPTRVGPDPAGVCVTVGELWALKAWRAERSAAVSQPYFGDRRRGWTAFCWAFDGTRPVGVVWTAAWSPLVRLAPREAVLAGLYTDPACRGRGIARALVRAACQHLKGQAVRTTYATVKVDDRPSRRVFEAVGFRNVGQFISGGVLGSRPATTRWSGATLGGAREPR